MVTHNLHIYTVPLIRIERLFYWFYTKCAIIDFKYCTVTTLFIPPGSRVSSVPVLDITYLHCTWYCLADGVQVGWSWLATYLSSFRTWWRLATTNHSCLCNLSVGTLRGLYNPACLLLNMPVNKAVQWIFKYSLSMVQLHIGHHSW